jgi:hypothetical protein
MVPSASRNAYFIAGQELLLKLGATSGSSRQSDRFQRTPNGRSLGRADGRIGMKAALVVDDDRKSVLVGLCEIESLGASQAL